MKKMITLTVALLFTTLLYSQTVATPFQKLGYDVFVGTSSKGEYAEFHDLTDVVEIGSVLYNTKTKEIVQLLDDGESTLALSSATSAMSIDPHCEKYYWISPYSYALNNPIKYVDPDGRDVRIFYKNDEGKNRSFVYNGTNASNAPQNTFVQNFITAYEYNVANGGGQNMQKAVTSSNIKIGLVEDDKNQYYNGTVYWNPNAGLQLDDGYVLSAATIAEHEFDHGVADATEGKSYTDRQKSTNDGWDTADEKRVIQGSERTTAIKNGELPSTHKGRKSHREGQRIFTGHPTATKEKSKQESINLNKRLDERAKREIKNFSSEW